MKKLLQSILVLSFFAGVLIMGTSCNNSGKNDSENAADSLSSTADSMKESFDSQVSNFDSTWNSTMNVLDTRIHQWDSTSQTYRGILKRKLQKEVSAIKVQRDSLKATLGQAGNQTREGWNDFRQRVNSRYDSILTSMQHLVNINQ